MYISRNTAVALVGMFITILFLIDEKFMNWFLVHTWSPALVSFITAFFTWATGVLKSNTPDEPPRYRTYREREPTLEDLENPEDPPPKR